MSYLFSTNVSKLVFLDLCAWQHSTVEIEMSDLAFNGGEGGAVHLKQRPLQSHSFVNMACISNVAASLKAPYADGCLVRQEMSWGWVTACVLISFQHKTVKKAEVLNMCKCELFLMKRFGACIAHLDSHEIPNPCVSPGAVSTSCHHLACSTQGPCCPAGDPDRAAETGGQTYQSIFNWNTYGECNTY